MANMSYCRFQNTYGDLLDCYESEGMYDPDGLSKEEAEARKRLIAICLEIASDLGYEEEE